MKDLSVLIAASGTSNSEETYLVEVCLGVMRVVNDVGEDVIIS